jgi:hypothetical protein
MSKRKIAVAIISILILGLASYAVLVNVESEEPHQLIGLKSDEIYKEISISKELLREKGFHLDELCDCFFRMTNLTINDEDYLKTSKLYVAHGRVKGLHEMISSENRNDSEVEKWMNENLNTATVMAKEVDTTTGYSCLLIW